jgi:hypothetical protein
VVVMSVVLNLAHTASHAGQHLVALPAWQQACVTVVVYAAPVVAAAMAGSLVFGLLYHFVVPGPDNVLMQPPRLWKAMFQVSAVLLAPLQVIGASIGLRAARRISRPSSTGAEKSLAGGLAGPRRPGSEPR